MNFKEFMILFLVALALFLSSIYDVFTDGRVTYYYFTGNEYEFRFENNTDPMIEKLNCTHLGYDDMMARHLYTCFSKETTLGIIQVFAHEKKTSFL